MTGADESAPWVFADEVEFRWDRRAVTVPRLVARRISRLGHPMTRWIDAAGRVVDGLPDSAGKAGFLVAEFRLDGGELEWMESHTDINLFAALSKGPMADLGLEPDLSVRKSEFAAHGEGEVSFLMGGEVFRRAKISTTLPSMKAAFLNRMRFGHWSRVRRVFDFEWNLESGSLPLGAQYPGVDFRSWDELAEVSTGDWEIVVNEEGVWKIKRRRQTNDEAWSVEIRAVLESDGTAWVRRRQRGDGLLAVYGRNADGWTDFLGCVAVERSGNELLLRPVEAELG